MITSLQLMSYLPFYYQENIQTDPLALFALGDLKFTNFGAHAAEQRIINPH